MRILNTAIIGAGGWGTALAGLWAKDARRIVIWGHNADRIVRMQETRQNKDYLPGLQLPDSVHITSVIGECADANLIVFATPSTALRNIAVRFAGKKLEWNAAKLQFTNSGPATKLVSKEYRKGWDFLTGAL